MGTNWPLCRGWGLGGKDEVNVLKPNNQHVDVFTGWPSSMGDAGRWVSGHYGSSEQEHIAPSRWMIDEQCFLLNITR